MSAVACSVCYGSGYGVDEKPCPCGCRPAPAIAPPVAAGSVDTPSYVCLREDRDEWRERAEKAEARVKELEAEDLSMHRKLAAETLRADQGWARYEAANQAKNDLERRLVDGCDALAHLPNEKQA